MKIRKVSALCKAEKTVQLVDAHRTEEQWVGDGAALYPLRGLPTMSEGNILRMFDISPNDSEKYQVRRVDDIDLPIDLSDIPDNGETKLPNPDICITYAGKDVMPLDASGKVLWIDPKYIDPVRKSGDLELYERVDANGIPYIAVKAGMMLEAIIYPLSIGDKMINRLKELGSAVHFVDPRTGEVQG